MYKWLAWSQHVANLNVVVTYSEYSIACSVWKVATELFFLLSGSPTRNYLPFLEEQVSRVLNSATVPQNQMDLVN